MLVNLAWRTMNWLEWAWPLKAHENLGIQNPLKSGVSSLVALLALDSWVLLFLLPCAIGMAQSHEDLIFNGLMDCNRKYGLS